jgi:S1-C subfamily serine protease
VKPLSPAEDAGLRPGDVILEADFKPIESAAGLRSTLSDAESAVLLVGRGDSTIFTTIRKS